VQLNKARLLVGHCIDLEGLEGCAIFRLEEANGATVDAEILSVELLIQARGQLVSSSHKEGRLRTIGDEGAVGMHQVPERWGWPWW